MHADPPAPATPARTGSARRSTSTCCRPTGTVREVPPDHRPQPRRRAATPGRRPPGCSPTTTWSGTPPGTGCRTAPARHVRTARRGCSATAPSRRSTVELGTSARPRRDAADAGAAGLGVPLPGRGAGAARGRRPAGHEVLQDPTFFRSGGAEKGRDGCRVPLPWTRRAARRSASAKAARTCPSRRGSRRCSVEAQEADPASTLRLYRKALAAAPGAAVRRVPRLGTTTGEAPVLHFSRPGGWHSVTNFGAGAGRAARRAPSHWPAVRSRATAFPATPPPGSPRRECLPCHSPPGS